MTPYQAWYGEKPNLSRLRVIGSKGEYLVPLYGKHPYQPLDGTCPWPYKNKRNSDRVTRTRKRNLKRAPRTRKYYLRRALRTRKDYLRRATGTRKYYLERVTKTREHYLD
ncbi:hypothetical protein BU23DRAFT_574413 [Bimuria novae-zelandiae CBS 107.79]|uniref:Uncharacterized protein n=1 Tax=Bimuria novae-zelandiae CBS 107.79 TaxID=1447943 RepID=A0A6A5UNT7_9PLEO|nr:hypothetical protein BU23DRAFT_574413 [Bimuria novae-zelandiae CBS 107.79]